MKVETTGKEDLSKVGKLGVWLGTIAVVFSAPIACLAAQEAQGPANPASELKNTEHKNTSYDVKVEKCDFGVVTDRSGPTKDWKLHPVVVIPNLPGIKYAWRIKIKDHSQALFVREEFSLPEAPSSWKIKQEDTTSQLLKGGELCVLENFQETDEGWIGHSWTASRGDPAGKYEIRIYLNGKPAHTFTFNVGDPDESEQHARDI